MKNLTTGDIVWEYKGMSSAGWPKCFNFLPGIKVGEKDLVEMVLIPEKNRATLCVSSQVGCAVDCSFCATGKQGFSRNLDLDEIIDKIIKVKQ